MKKLLLRIPLLLAALFLTSIPLSAHDFEVDGIYYNILDETAKTVEVRYSGNSIFSVENEYTGDVSIPNSVTYSGTSYSVTSIGNGAFSGCTGLTSVTIPNSVTSIGDNAFGGCTGLTSVTIPNSVTSIGDSTFSGCTGLTSITIPNSVTSIGSYAFSGCSRLTEVNITDLSAWCNIDFEGPSANPLDYAQLKLNGSEITNLVIPNDVYVIKKYAFSGCSELTEVTIPNSVRYIGDGAFYYCWGLTEVTIGNSVTEIGKEAFYECSGLTSVFIGNSVTEIGEAAFYGCDNLKRVINSSALTLSKRSTNYGYIAYYADLVINVDSIEGDFIWSEDSNVNVLVAYLGNANELILPTDFNGENYVIGDYAFSGCSDLTSVTIPNSVTKIGSGAFRGCSGLTNVTIGNFVTTIGDHAFSGCTGLTSVTIPNSVTSIGESAFWGCTGLTSVTIPNSVTSIGNYAFSGCSGLTSVTIPNSVTSIGYGEFSDCSALSSFTIGSSITSVSDRAFDNCTNLTKLIIEDGTEPLSLGRNDVSQYLVGEGLFYDCPLDTLYLGRNITYSTEKSYGYSPFYNKYTLKSVTIGNLVTSIGEKAFYACNKLTSLSIGNPNATIGAEAFLGCYRLVEYPTISVNQFNATITKLSTPTNYTPYLKLNNWYYYSGDEITGLSPKTKYEYDYGLIINGIYCQINVSKSYITTSPFDIYLNGTAGVTSLTANGSYSDDDATFVGEGINLGKEVTNFDNNNDSIFENLDPNTTYTVYYGVKIKESSSAITTSKTFTTGALEWSAGEYQATSTTSVRLMTETTCDATSGTGIEWRRYGAPESLAPNKAECPVVDGMLVGYLKGLNHEAYYEYRPYYTSASGKTYYGEWAAFFSGDAGVYFEPEVRTFTENSVDGNSVTIKGYALPGTDEVTGQGFEYWKTSGISTYSTDNVKTVSASGISMSVTLSNLDYNSTYCYRAFVTTAKGTTYGDTVEFSTGYPAGIYTVEADSDESTASFRIMPGMLVVNGEGDTPVMVAGMNGRVLFSGYAAGQLELPLDAGIYILRLGNDAHKVAIR